MTAETDNVSWELSSVTQMQRYIGSFPKALCTVSEMSKQVSAVRSQITLTLSIIQSRQIHKNIQ